MIINTLLMTSFKHCDALNSNIITLQLEYIRRTEQCPV